MVARTPLKLDGSNNLIEMSTTDINNIKSQVRYLYGTDPSVDLSYVSSGGSLGSISDTRLQAGASTTDVTNFDTEAETPDVSTVTIDIARISQANEDTTETADTNNIAFPIWNDNGNVKSMTLTEFYETFIYDSITTLSNGSDQPGTYRIHSANSLSGHTLISTNPVYSDTRANPDLYTAANIPEAQDQPTTITNYYLFRTNSGSAVSYSKPVFIRNADNNLQEYPEADFESLLQEWIRYTAASSTDGYSINYSYSTGTNRGSGMADTRLNGSGNYQQKFINANDYRAQEFPNGTAVTIATHYLKIGKN